MRRWLLIGSLFAFGVLVLYFVFLRLTQGQLVITTDQANNSITITDNAGTGKLVKQGHGSQSLTVSGGSYLITAKGSSGAAAQVVNVRRGQTTSVTINPLAVGKVEPVADNNAQNFVADASQIFFVDPSSLNLFQIGSNNVVHITNSSLHFTSVLWTGATYGVGLATDGHLYEISSGAAKILDRVPASSNISYALAPNKSLYVAYNSTVYHYISGSNPQKLLTTAGQPQLAASNDNLSIVTGGGKEGEATVTVLNLKTGNVNKRDIGTYVMSWSPSGKYLLLGDNSKTAIYDATLKDISTVAAFNISGPTWVDDSTVFYGVSDQLWNYNTTTEQSMLAATIPGKGAIYDLRANDDHSYLYMNAEKTFGSPVLKRIGLRRQPVPDVVYKLQDILPISTNDYLMTMVNFTKPTVTVQASKFADLGHYQQVAKTDLHNKGVDPDSITLRFNP